MNRFGNKDYNLYEVKKSSITTTTTETSKVETPLPPKTTKPESQRESQKVSEPVSKYSQLGKLIPPKSFQRQNVNSLLENPKINKDL